MAGANVSARYPRKCSALLKNAAATTVGRRRNLPDASSGNRPERTDAVDAADPLGPDRTGTSSMRLSFGQFRGLYCVAAWTGSMMVRNMATLLISSRNYSSWSLRGFLLARLARL